MRESPYAMNVGRATPPSRVTVRPYRRGDGRFFRQALTEAQDFYSDLDPHAHFWQARGYAARYANRLLRRMRRQAGIVLVGKLGDQPAGLIAAEVIRRRPHYYPIGEALNPRRYHSAEIVELYVRGAYRRRGVGRALMAEAERRLRSRGCDWVRLEVLAPNRVARALYADLGYRATDLRLGKLLRISKSRKLDGAGTVRRTRQGASSERSATRPVRNRRITSS